MPSPSRVNPDLRFQPTHVASIRRRLRDAASGSTPLGRRDIATLFRALDANSNGTLEWEEFRAGVRKYGRVLPGSVSDAELYQVFQFVDLNDNGVMSVEEFKWFMSAPDERLFGAPPSAAASVSRRGSPTASPGTSPPPGGPPCRPLRWNKRALDTMKQRLHASAYAVGGVQWPKLLARMDSSGTGALEWADFKRGIRAELHASPRDVPDADARRIFCFVDKACMGVVEVGELATFISGGPVDDGLGFYDGASGGGDSDGDDSPFGANHKAATPKARRDVAHHVTFAPTANDEAAAAATAAAANGQADGADASGGAGTPGNVRFDAALLARVRRQLVASAFAVGGVNFHNWFDRYGRNANGALLWSEFRKAVRRDGKITAAMVSDRDLRRVFRFVDTHDSGCIDAAEFDAFMREPDHRLFGTEACGGASAAAGDEVVPPRRQLTWDDAFASHVAGRLRDAAHTADGERVLWPDLFRRLDRDGSGELDWDEFRHGLRHEACLSTADFSTSDLRRLFCLMDTDCSGTISLAELEGFVTDHGTKGLAAELAAAAAAKPKRGGRRGVFASATVRRVKQKLRAAAYTAGGVNYRKLFKHYDRDNSGGLECDEFISAIRRDAKIAKREVSDKDLAVVFRAVDEDGGGTVDIDEFVTWLEQEDPVVAPPPPPSRRHRHAGSSSHQNGDGGGATGSGASEELPPLLAELLAAAQAGMASVHAAEAANRGAGNGADAGAGANASGEGNTGSGKKKKKGGSKRRRPKLNSGTVAQVKRKLRAAAYTVGGVNYRKLFKHYDRDNSGGLECDEFISAIRRDAKIPKREVSDRELAAVFSAVDDDGGGTVDIEEFVTWLEADGAGIAASPQRPAKSPAPAVGATHRGGSGGDGGGELAITPASKGAASTPGSNGTPHSARRSASRSPSRQRIARTRSSRSRSRGKSRKPRVRGESMNAAKVRKVKQKLRAAAYTAGGVDFAKLFKHYDRDNSGSLECDEFINAIRRDAKIAKREVSDKDLEGVFAIVDEDGGGSIDVDEFVTWLDAPDVSSLKDRRAKKKSPHAAKRHRAKPKAIDSRLRRFDPSRLAMVRHHLRREAQRAGDLDYSQLFRVYDTDGSGNLEWREFRSAIRHAAGIGEDKLSEADLRLLFRYVDLNDNGLVDVDEFETFLWIAEEEELFGPDASAAGGAGAGGAGGEAGADADADAADRAQAALRRPLQWDPKGVEMVKRRLRSAAYVAGGVQWAKLFRNMDSDGSGHLEWPEFLSGMRKHVKLAPRDIPDRDLRRMFMYVDRDCSGAVSVRELAAFVSEGMSLAKRTKSWTGRAPATAPRNVAVTVLRDRLVVTWDEPEDCGGSDVQSYTIHAEPLHNPPPPRLKGACPYASSHGAWVTSAVTPRSEVLTVVVDDDLMAEITHHKKNCWCVRVMLCGCGQDPDIACCVVVAFVAQVSTSCCSTQ